MDIKSLKLFSDIADAGSISMVSASHGVAQSALSKHIAALESEFNAKVFYRTGRGVVLTEFGQSIMPRVKSVLAEFEQLKMEIQESADIPGGHVTLALQTSIMQTIVDPLLQRLRRDFPNIELRLVEGFSGIVEETLASGRADIGVFSRYGGRSNKKTEEKLTTEDLYLVASAGDPVVSHHDCQLADALVLPLVLPGAPDGFRVMLLEEAKTAGVDLNTAIEADSLTAIREIVAHKTAYTILTREAVEEDVQRGRLAISRITKPVLSRTLVLATSTHQPISKASRVVSNLIRELLRPAN